MNRLGKSPEERLASAMVEAGVDPTAETRSVVRSLYRSGCRKMHPGIGWRHLSKSRVQESVPVAMVMHTHTLRLLALTEQ